jgi:hypothetical protein
MIVRLDQHYAMLIVPIVKKSYIKKYSTYQTRAPNSKMMASRVNTLL